MTQSPESRAAAAAARALTELARAERAQWRLPDGRPADGHLATLRADLEAIARGAPAPRGLVRWLTDWIPELEDPLVDAVAAVEQQAPDSR